MLYLGLYEHDLQITPEGCKDILEKLPLAETHGYFYRLDQTRPKVQKQGYARPFFKFFYKGKGYQISKKDIPQLRQALEEGITGNSNFAIGWRPIAATTGAMTRMNPETAQLRLNKEGGMA